jgi:hypothetical protein
MEPSPTNTVVDYDAVIPANKAKSVSGSENNADLAKTTTRSDIPPLSQKRKWSLLMVFCLGFFIDIWMYSKSLRSKEAAFQHKQITDI